jgi:aspartyl protease family protein
MFSILRNIIVAAFLLTIVAITVRDLPDSFDVPGAATSPMPVAASEDADGESDAGYASGGGVGEIEIAPSRHGQFVLEAQVNGERVEFLVDTGASVVVLDSETAARLGFDHDTLRFTGTARTANGVARIARIVLDEIVIGDLTVSSVEAAVVKTSMPTALLGMSFLARLEGYEVRDSGLVLRW